MKKNILNCLILIICFFILQAEAATDVNALLQKSDRARGGLNEGLSWEVAITSYEEDDQKESIFKVDAKNVNVLAKCTAPARQKGEMYLFNDRNLWVYRPNLRKPISVSSRQRLSGQTANGDIATTNYAKDYLASSLGPEEINGEKTEKLLLKAKSKDLTYDQIHYWISLKSGLALQADFLTLDGKPFKRATYKYDNKIKISGKDEPFVSEVAIHDIAFPQNRSRLVYKNLKVIKMSDGIFNVNNLAR